MRVLVSGGAGFIGSHLVESLLEQRHRVTVLDNFSTGSPANLYNLKNKRNLDIVKTDITDFNAISPYFKNQQWVFHLAALADVVPSVERPLIYHGCNVNGTINMLEHSRHHGVRRFIYAASSSCYGANPGIPTRENNKLMPQYPYALTKCTAESYVLHWGRLYGLPVVSLRLFNVYGPRSRTSGAYGAVFGVFMAQKLAGAPFTVVGDGEQKRDFVFVKDIVSAFTIAAESEIRNEVFNVGTGSPASINTLVELLGGKKVYIPKRPGEPECTHADIGKIDSMLGWQPRISLEEGVSLCLKQIDYWKDAPVWTPSSIKKETRAWFMYLSEKKYTPEYENRT
jgi:UDP-glucose 4-epimerase